MTKFNWYDRIIEVQVDITSYCNASCAACARNSSGGDVIPELDLNHFNFELWERLASVDLKGMLISKLTLNGNWGDAMMHPKIVEMMEVWTKYHPETHIIIATNGSMRSTEFWKKFANVMKSSSHQVEFSIDGLFETHSVYRRGTDFNKIIKNIETFIQNGGNATVAFTIFDHNQHQHQEVRALAKSMGCFGFLTRLSHSQLMEVKTNTENYTITAPSSHPFIKDGTHYNEWWKDTSSDARDHKIYDSIRNHVERSNKINTKCPWYNRAEIQIDPWHRVWPCCHVSNIGSARINVLKFKDDTECFKTDGKNNLKDYSLKEILSDPWFTNTIPDNLYHDVKNPWVVCQISCNAKKGGKYAE